MRHLYYEKFLGQRQQQLHFITTLERVVMNALHLRTVLHLCHSQRKFSFKQNLAEYYKTFWSLFLPTY